MSYSEVHAESQWLLNKAVVTSESQDALSSNAQGRLRNHGFGFAGLLWNMVTGEDRGKVTQINTGYIDGGHKNNQRQHLPRR